MSMDYREYILDHYRDPRNYGTLEQPTIHWEESNPLCGDQIAIDLLVENNIVTEIRFQGKGCAISQSSTSMLTEMIEGKPIDEVVALGKEDILEMLGIPISPARTKCAFLSLKALHRGLVFAGLEHPKDEDEDEDE